MSLRAEYSLGHSEFNPFLFALVGLEKSGQPLTVLSALARLGLDPWEESARLSKMTKEAATAVLTAAIADLPEGDWKASDSQSIASRLVDWLPRHRAGAKGNAGDQGDKPAPPASGSTKWLTRIALALAVLLVIIWERSG